MIGLAFDVCDSKMIKVKDDLKTGNNKSVTDRQQEKLLQKYTYINPSIMDIVCFAFCYIGTLTGKSLTSAYHSLAP